MKKIYITLGIVLMLGIVSAGLISSAVDRADTKIAISSDQKSILEARDLTNPTISEMNCDGDTCRSCAKKGDYGMGCVSIAQQYCSSFNETLNDRNQTTNECLEWSDYTTSDLEEHEAKAYKIRWEGIADGIVEREARVTETKLREGVKEISAVSLASTK